MAVQWTKADVRRRLREVLNEYSTPASPSTIHNRMPSCVRHKMADELRQMSNDGEVLMTGNNANRLYSLAFKADVRNIMANLWRRDPVFTELSVRSR